MVSSKAAMDGWDATSTNCCNGTPTDSLKSRKMGVAGSIHLLTTSEIAVTRSITSNRGKCAHEVPAVSIGNIWLTNQELTLYKRSDVIIHGWILPSYVVDLSREEIDISRHVVYHGNRLRRSGVDNISHPFICQEDKHSGNSKIQWYILDIPQIRFPWLDSINNSFQLSIDLFQFDFDYERAGQDKTLHSDGWNHANSFYDELPSVVFLERPAPEVHIPSVEGVNSELDCVPIFTSVQKTIFYKPQVAQSGCHKPRPDLHLYFKLNIGTLVG